MLRLGVLGELTLEIDGEPREPPTSRRARLLLGLLAVDRRRHSRAQLAGRLWPEVLDESARTSLRSALSALRRSLGPDADRYLLAGRETVSLAGDEIVCTDLSEFDSLLAAGRTAEALERCRGDLLEGLDDDWVLERRDEHRDRVAQALARLAAEAEERGDLATAVAVTRRHVALDPLAEEAQRELIRRSAAAGDRPAALMAYRRLQDRLRTELGIAPSAQTRELVESLRAGAAPARGAGPAPAAPARERPTGTVTVLFTDQVGSTKTLQELGDDRAERLRRTHFAVLREVASAHRGQEVKNLGDGMMVAFTSAVDAVACAVGIQQATNRHAEDRLRVRVGLNVGEPIVDRDDYFGTAVVVAKRLCDRAGGGQILATDVVRALVGTRGGFEFRRLGALALKGIAEPVESCEVRWGPASVERIPLPPAVVGTETGVFVGRTDTLAELRRHFAAAVDGDRRVVLLAGEPGIGKTRLAAEFCRGAHADGAAVLAGRCYEEMLVPYQPFVEALRHYVRACPPDELTAQVGPHPRELAALVPQLGDPAADATRSTAEPEQQRFRLFDAVASLLTEAARVRPVVVVLDDLHWADKASLVLLRHLARATHGSRVLFLGTYRRTELGPSGDLSTAIAELRRARTLHHVQLEGLPEPEVAALIAAHAGSNAPEDFTRAVAQRTEGNPFFIEELLRHLEDPARPALRDLGVPEGVKELLLRRLERLADECRDALGVASVIGRRFELSLLARVLDTTGDELVDLLDAAVRGHALAEEAVGHYRFAHPLIRETIYGDLSATRRAVIHRRVGTAIESLHAASLAAYAGTLAHHYRAAGDAGKAFEYHRRAADEAERGVAPETTFEHLTGAIATGELLGRTAQGDAVMRDLYRRRAWVATFGVGKEVALRDYTVALEAARAAGDRELELHVLQGLGTLWHIRDSAVSARYQEQALAIAEALGDRAGQVTALNRLSLVHANQLDLERALDLGRQALALARASGDEPAICQAMDSLKFVALMLGDTRELERLTAQLAPAQRRRREVWYLQWTLLESAFTPIAHGRWEDAAARLDEAITISRRIGDIHARGLILSAQCTLERSRGDYARALAFGRESVRAAMREPGDPWLGWTSGTLGLALADLRAWPQALEAHETALAGADRIDARGQAFGVLGDLAWARLQVGDDAGARAAADRWDRMVGEVRTPPGTRYLYRSQTYRNRARVALALGEVDRAEAILQDVREPLERFGIREATADVRAILGACAEARGDEVAARRLLARGLDAVGDEGLPAARLALRIALARLAPTPAAAAAHVEAACALIDQIADSADDEALGSEFRSAAFADLAIARARRAPDGAGTEF